VPNDEAAGPGAPGHPDDQPQPSQPILLLADDVHGPSSHPEKKVAFRVDINNTIWSYELEPTDTGTRVVKSRPCREWCQADLQRGINAFMGGGANFEW